jgi:hypothetical protein
LLVHAKKLDLLPGAEAADWVTASCCHAVLFDSSETILAGKAAFGPLFSVVLVMLLYVSAMQKFGHIFSCLQVAVGKQTTEVISN